MTTIWIPLLAIGGLILLFRFQKGKASTHDPSKAGSGMGCCGGGEIPADRDGKLEPSAANRCH